MTKDEILRENDASIAYRIIEQTFNETNERYLNEEFTDEEDYKIQGYLDGLKFSLDILRKTKDIRELIKND